VGTGRWWVGVGGGVGVGVLLEEGNGELLAEIVGALLALGEGDEVVVGGLREHEVESSAGLDQEAATQFIAVGGHGNSSKRSPARLRGLG
jgi:hypothetical protein